METSEPTPRTGIRADDLAELTKLEGPFTTIYLSTEPDVDNQAGRSVVAWRNLRRELEDADVPENVLDGIETYVPDAHKDGAALGVIADDAQVLHVEYGYRPPARDLAIHAALPRLTGFIEWRQAARPYVMVLIDRIGADIEAVRPGGADIDLQVEGHDVNVRKVGPGGWSQRRFQQRAENFWEDNAKAAAALLARAVDAVEPAVVFVAGDVRALQLLREEARQDVVELLHEVTGGRSEDGSAADMAAEIATALEAISDQETAELLQLFEQERGQHDRASEGVAATIAALERAQVDTLLLVEDLDDARTAWFGPDPTQVAAGPGDLSALGVAAPVEARLGDALVRAALGTGASVRIVPAEAGIAEGVGAILRWS
jgi:hypothetical protein